MATADTIPLLTLSTFGYVTNHREKLDMALAQYFERRDEKSIQYLRMKHGNDLIRFIDDLQGLLSEYLGRYYPVINIELRPDPTVDPNSNSMTIQMYGSYGLSDGSSYDISAQLLLNGDKMTAVINAIDNG